jgi:S-adenosylmethionine:tRNA-ribosyltransferase-isomerase (queuine synthetase)
MKLSHFQFDLPKEQLSTHLRNRDEARLMVIDQ